jgi:signal transduction histidine kinase
MSEIKSAIFGTPWWVFLLFAYCIYIGVKALKSRVASIKRIFILPLIFIAWSVWNLVVNFSGFLGFLTWAIFITLGYFIGWGMTQSWKIAADKKKLLIGIPGNRITLILLIAVFAVKYFFGYYRATHAEMSALVAFANLIASGLITGIFVGRTMSLLKKFAKAKHEKLKLKKR